MHTWPIAGAFEYLLMGMHFGCTGTVHLPLTVLTLYYAMPEPDFLFLQSRYLLSCLASPAAPFRGN